MNGTRHVVLALTLSAIVLIIAGDRWNEGIGALRPVRPAPKT